MDDKEKKRNSFLVALLLISLIIILILVYIRLKPETSLKEIFILAIPSALVALASFPIVFFILIKRGILLSTLSEIDSKKIVQQIIDEFNKAGFKGKEENLINTSACQSALVIVNIQNDFFEGGTIPIKQASSLIEPLNEAIDSAYKAGFLVIVIQDLHPENHQSFIGHGGNYKTHCVKGTSGAQLHPELKLPTNYEKIYFGSQSNQEGYSPMENSKMEELFSTSNLQVFYVVGIATEYCVLAACRAVKDLKRSVFVIESLVRAAKPDKLSDTWNNYEEYGIMRSPNLAVKI